MLPWPLARGLEGKLHDALNAMSCEDRYFSGGFPGPPNMRAATVTSILALGILPDDDPIQLAGLAIGKRRLCPTEYFCGTHVGVLLERLANRKAKTPKRNVIWYI